MQRTQKVVFGVVTANHVNQGSEPFVACSTGHTDSGGRQWRDLEQRCTLNQTTEILRPWLMLLPDRVFDVLAMYSGSVPSIVESKEMVTREAESCLSKWRTRGQFCD